MNKETKETLEYLKWFCENTIKTFKPQTQKGEEIENKLFFYEGVIGTMEGIIEEIENIKKKGIPYA